jgi:hypothetical protein
MTSHPIANPAHAVLASLALLEPGVFASSSPSVRLGQYETSATDTLPSRLYHWKEQRGRLAAWEALASFQTAPLFLPGGQPLVTPTTLERFRYCATSTTVVRHKDRDEWRLLGNFCRNRWCPSCSKTRRRRIVHAIHPAIAAALAADPKHPPRMVTLTIAHHDEPLGTLLDHLRKCWRALTQDPWWQAAAVGGIWAIEIKPGKRGGWHPHLHAIVLSHWISARTLRIKWRAITGGSDNIDVQQIDARPGSLPHAAIGYIAKYISKPAALDLWSLDRRREIIRTARSTRLWSCWGTLAAARRTLALADKDIYHRTDWLTVAPLTDVVNRAIAGDAESTWLLGMLRLDDWHSFSRSPYIQSLPTYRPAESVPAG